MAKFKLNTSKKGKTKKSTSSNASVRRANQRVRDAKSAGFGTTSKFTDSVRAGNTARPSSGSTDVSQGTVRETARNIQGGNGTLTSDSLRSATNKIKLTSPNTQVVGDVSANVVGLTSENTTNTGGVLTPAPQTEDKYAGAQANQNYLQSEMQKYQDDRTTGAEIQRQLERESGIKEARQRENDLSAQINTIIANRDASILSEEGQGRGIPESIIGGRQAKINKEAAIAALPVQALLAQAQGNVALAEAHINTWGKILMDDANNEYNQKKELLTSAYDFAQGIEFKRIDELNAANERKYQENKEFIQAKTNAMANAAGQEAGQSVMSAIQSATTLEQVVAAAGVYNGDVLGREAQKASIAASRASTANSYDAIAKRAEESKNTIGTLNGKPQTQSEKTAEGYAIRTMEAGAIVEELGGNFIGPQSYAGAYLPNIAKTEDRQKFEQAQRNFINAVLRRESGAVIGPSEFESARLQYFPQPGDSQGVLAQKKQNRDTTTLNLFNEGNVSMPELETIDDTTPLATGYEGVTTSGLTFTVE